MNENNKEIESKAKEALLNAKESLLLTALSIPFGLMSWILKASSSFALDILGIAVVGFIICMPLTIYWYRVWKRLTSIKGPTD